MTTSRYRLAPAGAPPIRFRARRARAAARNLGDDPLRAVSRLPGAAASDFTAKANIRGGEADEMLVRFDGLRLFNPFHFKDFQSLFSTIDPGIIRGIDVYTGAFPAAFGDRMSGVIDIASLQKANAPQRELSLSFFNASAASPIPSRTAAANGCWPPGAATLTCCSICSTRSAASRPIRTPTREWLPVHGRARPDCKRAAL